MGGRKGKGEEGMVAMVIITRGHLVKCTGVVATAHIAATLHTGVSGKPESRQNNTGLSCVVYLL